MLLSCERRSTPRSFRHLLLLCVVAMLGCQRAAGERNVVDELSPGATTSASLEAGIVFTDKANYLCWPFERLELDDATLVTEVKTSCECVKGSVVSYRKSKDLLGSALLLEFAADASLINDPPASLGVIVTLKLATGAARELTVNLLHTPPL